MCVIKKCAFILIFIISFSNCFLFAESAYEKYENISRPAPWAITVYEDDLDYPLFRVSFPPFDDLTPKFISFSKEISPKPWLAVVEYEKRGKVITESNIIYIPTKLVLNRFLFSDYTHPRYFPNRKVRKITLIYKMRYKRDENGEKLALIGPTAWIEREYYVNGKFVDNVYGYRMRDRTPVNEIVIPNEFMKDGDINTIECVLYMTNYHEDLYSYHKGKHITVKKYSSNISPYAQRHEIIYRRRDYYRHTIFESILSPMKVMRTVNKEVVVAGLKNDVCDLSETAFYTDKFQYRKKIKGVVYSKERDGRLKENFIVFFGADYAERDFPVILTFNLMPDKIVRAESGSYIFYFPYKPMYTAISVMPFSEKVNGISQEESRMLRNGLSASDLRRAREISKLAFTLPVSAEQNMKYFSFKHFHFKRFETDFLPSYKYHAPHTTGLPVRGAPIKGSLKYAGKEYIYFKR